MIRILFSILFFLFIGIAAFCQIQQLQTPQFHNVQQVNIPLQSSVIISPNPNSVINSPKQEQKKQEQQFGDIEKLIKEANKPNNEGKYGLPSNSSKPDVQFYYKAYDDLNKMLTGETPINIKKAVFTVENAFVGNKMSYEKFDEAIQEHIHFYKLKFEEEKLNPNSNEDKNYLLFRLLSDTLTTIDPATKQKTTHYPINYDFEDFEGKVDYRNMFVSKLLITNYGQCHSMPLLYLILAQEIGAEAFLSTAPNHLFVKYRNGLQWKNVELTNGHITTDAFAIGSGYITSTAIRNRTYLDTFSKMNLIGNMLEDLAEGYIEKYGADEFLPKCLSIANEVFPNSWRALVLLGTYYHHQLLYVIKQTSTDLYNDSTTNHIIATIPEAKTAYLNRERMRVLIESSGHRNMPAEAYANWLKSLDEDKMNKQYQQFLKWKKQNKTYISSTLNN